MVSLVHVADSSSQNDSILSFVFSSVDLLDNNNYARSTPRNGFYFISEIRRRAEAKPIFCKEICNGLGNFERSA